MPFPGIFRIRTISGINVTALFIAMALFSMFFFVSLYMQQVLGFDALEAGLAYLPLAVGIIISAGLASQLTTRFGFKPVLIAGLLLTAAGLVWFSQVSPGGSYVGDVLFPSLLAAVGLGFAFVPMTIAAVSGVEPHEAGLASGLINTSQQIGGALGLAILATIANGRTDDAAAAGNPLPVALTEGFQSAFLVGAGFAVVGALAGHVPDLQPREPRARRGGAARRARPRPRGRLTHTHRITAAHRRRGGAPHRRGAAPSNPRSQTGRLAPKEGSRPPLRGDRRAQVRQARERRSVHVGLVGDHADKLSRIEPIAHDDDERPSREDRDYGQTIFTRGPVPLPRFLKGREVMQPRETHLRRRPRRPPRIKARWFFVAALVLAVLAFWILPTPFSGFAALLCVGAFITGGARLIQAGDPEMARKVTHGGFIGGGGF